MMQPGEKRVLDRPIRTDAGGASLHWVDGAVQTMFGQDGVSAGKTLFGSGRADKKEGPPFMALSTDLLHIAVKIPEVADLGRPQDLRKLLMSYFKDFDRSCAAAHKPEGLTEQVRYALTALIDEAIIATQGECRDDWLNEPLQVQFYSDHLAGENFFNRLEELLRDPRRNLEAIEIFYMCLVLGFKGRYGVQGEEKLPVIMRNLLKKIESIKGKPPRALSPKANVHAGRKSKEKTGRLWVLTAAGILLAALIYFFSLMATSDSALEPARSVVEKAYGQGER